MARTSTYLNFTGQTEAAFNFYKNIFQTEFIGDILRYSATPPQPGAPPLSEKEKQLIMHMELPILGGHVLMGTDVLESMGMTITEGNAFHLNLEPDSREETDRLFAALSENGRIVEQLQHMFWGGYFGICIDKFGIRWMFNFAETPGN